MKVRAFALSLFFSSLIALSPLALAVPGDWWGVVTIDGSPAAEGTVVAAYVNGKEAMNATVGAIAPGYYLVHVEGSEGDSVTFKVAGVDAEQGAQAWSAGDHRLDLSANLSVIEVTTTIAPGEAVEEETTTTTLPTTTTTQPTTTTAPAVPATTTTLPIPQIPGLPTAFTVLGMQIPTLPIVLVVLIVAVVLVLILKKRFFRVRRKVRGKVRGKRRKKSRKRK